MASETLTPERRKLTGDDSSINADSDCVKRFGYAIHNFDTDPKVVEEITKYVGFDREDAIDWFTEMRKEWEKNPPKTPEEASRLALRGAETANSYGFNVFEMDPFLSYYGLPHYFDYMTDKERGRTVTELGGPPYPDVDEDLDEPWMAGGGVPDHVETFDNRITATEGSDEPHSESDCVEKLGYAIKNFDTNTKVVEKVAKYVRFHQDDAIAWFTEMRKEWAKNPPKTPEEASRLALRGAETSNSYGFNVFEMDPFLSYYGLPHYFDYMTDKERGRTVTELGGAPYPDVDEDLDKPWMAGGGVPDHVETFDNIITATEGSDEPHSESDCVEKLGYAIKNFDTDTKPFLSYYGLPHYFDYMTDKERGRTLTELGGAPYLDVDEDLEVA